MMSNVEDWCCDNVYLEEVDSNCIEEEVTTTDMCLLEPLVDHNYISPTKPPDAIEPILKSKPARKIIKKPKITSLSLLYNCKICGYATTKHDVFIRHQHLHKLMPPKMKYVPCDNCNINRKAPKGYHMCPYCSFLAKNVAGLRVHMHLHSSGTAYKCKECNFSGKDMKELVNHIKTAQTYVCDTCSFSSHVHKRMVEHLKKHTKKEAKALSLTS